jgi:hypothetical protein
MSLPQPSQVNSAPYGMCEEMASGLVSGPYVVNHSPENATNTHAAETSTNWHGTDDTLV